MVNHIQRQQFVPCLRFVVKELARRNLSLFLFAFASKILLSKISKRNNRLDKKSTPSQAQGTIHACCKCLLSKFSPNQFTKSIPNKQQGRKDASKFKIPKISKQCIPRWISVFHDLHTAIFTFVKVQRSHKSKLSWSSPKFFPFDIRQIQQLQQNASKEPFWKY